MRIRPGFVLTELGGEYVAVPVDVANEIFQGVIHLNETGKVIWEGFAAGLDEDELAAQLAEQYDVDKMTALRDVQAVAKRLREAGLCEET